MCRTPFILLSLVVYMSLVASATMADAAPPAKPNFVFFLIDDLGQTDLSCYGSKLYETPNIDRLARRGMRFTDAYAACCVCSPTRAAVMTGKYPARLHITDWIAGHARPFAKLQVPDWTKFLPHEEVTLAEALQPAGYASGIFGKWHLGGDAYKPETQGFAVNLGGDHRGQPPSYFSPYGIPSIPDGPKGEYLTDRLADEAEKFLDAQRDKPFFLYFPHYAVHTPIQAKPEMTAKYRAKVEGGGTGEQKNAAYAAMIESVDQSVGRLLKKLDDLKIADRTYVIFTSDNGGLIPVTHNAPLRAGKGSPWEGGTRVAAIVAGPGIEASTTCAVPIISVDYYPTLLALAGAPGDAKHNAAVDGESLVPLLKQTGGLKRNAIYWHYPHYHPGGATPYGAVREGDFKLIEFYEDGHVELYNLKDDVGEQNDLSAKLPEKTAQLKQRLSAWRQNVGAQMPAPNPNFDPEKEKQRPARRTKA